MFSHQYNPSKFVTVQSFLFVVKNVMKCKMSDYRLQFTVYSLQFFSSLSSMFCLYEPNEILQVSRPCKVQLLPVSAARPVQSEAGISHNLHSVITTDLTQAD